MLDMITIFPVSESSGEKFILSPTVLNADVISNSMVKSGIPFSVIDKIIVPTISHVS